MLSNTNEGLLHVIIDHIVLSVMPQLAISIAELKEIGEDNPDKDDTRPEDLLEVINAVAEQLSDIVVGIVNDMDGVTIPSGVEIRELEDFMENLEYDDEEDEPEGGFLGFIQDITKKEEDE